MIGILSILEYNFKILTLIHSFQSFNNTFHSKFMKMKSIIYLENQFGSLINLQL